uniref:Mitochondrial assembly of ribosomal large subunit protein 1 n=1 Tax=Salvator merianae TaxID=96440 RepID=A0A8D0B8P3_SALMN
MTSAIPTAKQRQRAESSRGGRLLERGLYFSSPARRLCCPSCVRYQRTMWRGARCLQALLGRTPWGEAGLSKGARGLRETVNLAAVSAPRLPSLVASLGSRRLSGVGSSELREAEGSAGLKQDLQEEVIEQQQRRRLGPAPSPSEDPPDKVSSVFSIDDMVSLLRQENAKDICVIELTPEMKYSNYFIIVSGSSTRHLQAMAQYLVKMYKHQKTEYDPHVIIEGKECEDWLCIDFDNIIVHFMLPETREFYELEKLWTLGSYDDQLAQMISEPLPDDFIFGLTSEDRN